MISYLGSIEAGADHAFVDVNDFRFDDFGVNGVGVPTYDRFADTQYIEISNHINAEVEGKRWDEIRADNFIEAINYITVEAVAYYMPSIFIHNLQNKDELNWLLCLRIQSGHLCVPYRQELYEVLNQAQRALVAKYMVQIGGFFPQDIEFWQTTNPSD